MMLKRSYAAAKALEEVVIVSFARTPIGSFNGALAPLSAIELGATAFRAALERANIPAAAVDELYLGNVIGSGLGQAPATQVALGAGLPNSLPCTSVNKVCASGMKAVMLGSQAIALGQAQVVLAGGAESMSNAPHLVPKLRGGLRYGPGALLDSLVTDGLSDAFSGEAMGMCGEYCSADHDLSRAAQDDYAERSYRLAQAAGAAGYFAREIAPVRVPGRRPTDAPTVISVDEEYSKVDFAKLRTLRPAFKKDGVITAANSSKLNDGAAALVLCSRAYADAHGLTPLARVRGYADAATRPRDFTVAPALAIPIALQRAGVRSVREVDAWEINEAFACVALVNQKLCGFDGEKLNVRGGAVALGHPIGMSGARIVGALLGVLEGKKGKIGCAAICNGGGGASAVVIEIL